MKEPSLFLPFLPDFPFHDFWQTFPSRGHSNPLRHWQLSLVTSWQVFYSESFLFFKTTFLPDGHTVIVQKVPPFFEISVDCVLEKWLFRIKTDNCPDKWLGQIKTVQRNNTQQYGPTSKIKSDPIHYYNVLNKIVWLHFKQRPNAHKFVCQNLYLQKIMTMTNSRKCIWLAYPPTCLHDYQHVKSRPFSRPTIGWICVGHATLPAYLSTGQVQNVAIIHLNNCT